VPVERILTDNPLQFIQKCVRERKILWTYHVNMRLKGRSIPRQTVLESHASYEILEAYPDDKYLPSYLVYSEYEGDIFHVLFAVDTEEENVRIITVYRPDPDEWEEDLKTRRHSL
jgi:Domain of unknown function (DUF4258)